MIVSPRIGKPTIAMTWLMSYTPTTRESKTPITQVMLPAGISPQTADFTVSRRLR